MAEQIIDIRERIEKMRIKFDDDHESDIAAVLRSVWVVVHLLACFFIIIHNGVKLGWF